MEKWTPVTLAVAYDNETTNAANTCRASEASPNAALLLFCFPLNPALAILSFRIFLIFQLVKLFRYLLLFFFHSVFCQFQFERGLDIVPRTLAKMAKIFAGRKREDDEEGDDKDEDDSGGDGGPTFRSVIAPIFKFRGHPPAPSRKAPHLEWLGWAA